MDAARIRGRYRSSSASLSRFDKDLSAIDSLTSASPLLDSSSSYACVNPGVSVYDAIQTLPDTFISAQLLKMPEFKHLAEVIQSSDNNKKLTVLVPTDESIHNSMVLHYNMTCKQSNEIIDELIAQIGDKDTECKKLDLLVRMTGLMSAVGKKMKGIIKQKYTNQAKISTKQTQSSLSQQPIKSSTDNTANTPCPVNTPCPSSVSAGRMNATEGSNAESSAAGGRGRKHLLCSSPALRRDALAKLCEQLGIRQEDFNLTFSSLSIQAITDNFLYSIIQGQHTTDQFKATNILPTLLDNPTVVRLNATASNNQMMFIKQSDANPSRFQVVYDIPSSEHSWYSTIIRPNLPASNGVLHLIDGPIQTPMNPIFKLALAKFDNFLEMAIESGLAPMLANKPGVTLFVPLESANKLIKNAFGFESNEAKYQSMLKNELVSQLNDIIAMVKVNQYAMQYRSSMTGQQEVMADKPLSMNLLQKARSNLMEADSFLAGKEKHSVLANKFEEMRRQEQKAKGMMAANPWSAGGPMPNNQWNYQQNLDQVRQAAQNFIARCLQQFGQESEPSIYINPRSSTGIIPDSPSDALPQRFGYAAKSDSVARGVLGSGVTLQPKSLKRRHFGMSMKSKDDRTIEVPVKGWEYRLNRPSLLSDLVMAAVDHLFTHESALSQPLFDNWNKTQTYADFISLHAVDGVWYTKDFQDGVSVSSMQGQSFTIKNASDSASFGGGADLWKIDQSTILFPNIITSNGVIHIIDQPLGTDLLPTQILKQLIQKSPSLRTALTEKQVNRGLLGLFGPCPSPSLKSLKAKAFPARKPKALPIKSSIDELSDTFDDDDDDEDDDFLDDDFDDDSQYIIPSLLSDDQQTTIITIRHITEIIAKLAPRRGDEMINLCGDELTPDHDTQLYPPMAGTFGVMKPTTSVSPIQTKPSPTMTTIQKPPITSTPTTTTKQITTVPSIVATGSTEPPKCPPTDQVCLVNDPLLYSSPKPICYNINTHLCVNNNFVCPIHAPNLCGRSCYHKQIYKCKSNDDDRFKSRLFLLKQSEAEQKQIKLKDPTSAPASPAPNVQPILDALQQIKAKQIAPTTAATPQNIQQPTVKLNQTIVQVIPIQVIKKNETVAAAPQPIKQTPIKQAETAQTTIGKSIVDVLTMPSPISANATANQQAIKSSSVANQTLPSMKQSVQAPLQTQPIAPAKQSSPQPITQRVIAQQTSTTTIKTRP